MTVDHHDLVHEFPEHKERIHQLKMDNAHFAKLFDEYNDLTNRIEVLENNGVPVADESLEDMKKQRLALKDALYAMLTA
ncbi:MAG: YdcH family protein [Halothiobacillaceae bacterium]